ncbi:MAG TPA: hypothetical protein VHA74_02530, partial [Candidatus Dojkabacteria bacterium]|nr:hypothetical protein [Candidatus Dojkabacteria bacterium]
MHIVNLNVHKEKKSTHKVNYFGWFLTSLILAMISFFGYVYVLGGRNMATFQNILGVNSTNFTIPYVSYNLAFDSSISTTVKESIKKELSDMEFTGIKRFNFVATSDNKITFTTTKDNNTFFNSYIVPVGHFYWIKDGIKSSDLSKLKIYALKSQQTMIQKLLDDKYGGDFKVSGVDDLKSVLKISESSGVGFVDISNLDYEYKLLTLDDKYFFDDKAGGIKYGLDFVGGIPDEIENSARKQLANNDVFDISKVASINMTGVTALTRNLAIK